MHVGMNRSWSSTPAPRRRVPHARGDEPAAEVPEVLDTVSSPCTWG